VPCGFSRSGLPIGLLLSGPPAVRAAHLRRWPGVSGRYRLAPAAAVSTRCAHEQA
jgi:hypothetical protein